MQPEPVPGRQSAINRLTVFSALVLGAVIGGMAVEYWFVKHAVAMADDVLKKSRARRARFGVIWAVESHRKKYSHFPLTQITNTSLPILSHRGAYPDRQRRGAGCGGRGSVRRET